MEAVETVFTPELLGEEQFLDDEIGMCLYFPVQDRFNFGERMLTSRCVDISCEEAMSYIGGG